MVIGSAVAAVVLVVAGLVTWRVVSNRRLAEARADCAEQSETLRKNTNAYNAVVNGDAADASGITAQQVADGETVSALAKDLKATPPALVACNSDDTDTLTSRAKVIGEHAKWYANQTQTLTSDVAEVTKSRDAKTLADAKTALNGKISDAQNLLKDSEGKVQDNQSREDLTKAIQTAQKVTGTKSADYMDAVKSLQSVMDTVNASVSAKMKADQEAAAAAQEAANRASSQGSSGSSNTNTSGGSGSANSSGSGGGSNSGGSSSLAKTEYNISCAQITRDFGNSGMPCDNSKRYDCQRLSSGDWMCGERQ